MLTCLNSNIWQRSTVTRFTEWQRHSDQTAKSTAFSFGTRAVKLRQMAGLSMSANSGPGLKKMKIDQAGRAIRAKAERAGMRWECQFLNGKRLWWLTDRLGRPPVGGSGTGIDDREALEFLGSGIIDQTIIRD